MQITFTLINSVGCQVATKSVQTESTTYTTVRDSLVRAIEKEDWLIDDGDTITISIDE